MDKIYIEEEAAEYAKTVNGTDIYRDGEYGSKMDFIAGAK